MRKFYTLSIHFDHFDNNFTIWLFQAERLRFEAFQSKILTEFTDSNEFKLNLEQFKKFNSLITNAIDGKM